MKYLAPVIISLLLFPSNSFSDDDLKGLIWEIGAGLSGYLISYKAVLPRETSGSLILTQSQPSKQIALLLNGRIGFAPFSSFGFLISNNSTFLYPGNTLIIDDFISLDLLFRLSKMKRPIYFGVGCGYGFWFYPFSTDWNINYSRKGIAVPMRAGMEVFHHLAVELGFCYSQQSRVGTTESVVISPMSGTKYSQTIRYSETFASEIINLKIIYLGY
jgi:hypothetical protein